MRSTVARRGAIAAGLAAALSLCCASVGNVSVAVLDTIAPPVQHTPPRAVQAGSVLPLEVSLRRSSGMPVSGSLYYLLPGDSDYVRVPLAGGGGYLSAVIPCGDVSSGRQLRYYIEVDRAGERVVFGTAARPYSVQVLSERQFLLTELKVSTAGAKAGSQVTFTLDAGNAQVDSAVVVFLSPRLSGEARLPLRRSFGTRLTTTVPGESVDAGLWRYYVEANVSGRTVRLPATGFAEFSVSP